MVLHFSKLLAVPFRYKPWRPRHLRLIARDLMGVSRQREFDHGTHLEAAVHWLCRAQDQREGTPDAGGVSAGWSFEDGWLPSYPETSGYIVETFVAASEVLSKLDLLQRAHRILDWELSIQNPDGSFPGHFGEAGSRPVIFNTGQILHGLIAGYRELGRSECLDAAARAGLWMAQQQDDDGCWRRSVHNGVPHTYNTRAAWALLRVGLLVEERQLQEAAVRNLEWALHQQTESGWFRTNAFVPDRPPFTHTIAYAMRGLLEGGLLAGDGRFVSAAQKAAWALANAQRADGWLPGAFDDGWNTRGGYCCLTGLAQITIVWQRMARALSETRLLDHVWRALAYLKRNHRMDRRGQPEDGGLAGSVPIWGAYSRFEYPNWSAKFFADALMMDIMDIAVPSDTAGHRPDAKAAADV